jgi:hypothetical protein
MDSRGGSLGRFEILYKGRIQGVIEVVSLV